MSKIIDRAGSGASITPTENDANLDSLHGINQVIAGATHTVDITDQGDTLEFTNAGAVAVTLDSIATIQGAAHTSDFHITLIATNAATVATITPNGANSFNTGVATIVLTVDEYVTLETDSTGLVWNVINSSDASQVGGLSASQFLRSDASDTTTGNLVIDKAEPAFHIKCAAEATENTTMRFLDESSVGRALIYRPAGADQLRIDARDALGASQAALLITEAGKVNVSTGTFQLAGVDVTSTAAELNILDGVTSTAAELNILDGVTSTAAELNTVDGSTAATPTTVAAADRAVFNDNGTMMQVSMTDLKTFFSGGLNTKIVNIGDWNMDATSSVSVAHGVTLSKIRTVVVSIRNDANTNGSDISLVTAIGTLGGGASWDATNIILVRVTGGVFDAADYDSTSYNRGWITIQYTD